MDDLINPTRTTRALPRWFRGRTGLPDPPPLLQDRATAAHATPTALSDPADPDAVDLHRLLHAVRRGVWAIAGLTLLGALGLAGAAALQPRLYTATTTLLLEPAAQRVVAPADRVVDETDLTPATLASQVALLRSTALTGDVIARVGADRLGGTPEEMLSQALTVRRLGDSHVIEIAATAHEPGLASDIANAVARAYTQARLSARQAQAARATRWLADQVPSRRTALAQAEAALDEAERAAASHAGDSPDLIDLQLRELSREQALIRADRAREAGRLAHLRSVLDGPDPALAAQALTLPEVETLRARRTALTQAYDRAAATLGPAHPERRALEAEAAGLDAAITQALASALRRQEGALAFLTARAEALRGQMAALRAQRDTLAQATLDLRTRAREIETERAGFQALLARLDETRAQEALQEAGARVLSVARPPRAPARPRIGLMALTGGLLGLSAGLMLALGREYLSRGVVRADALVRLTGLPVLAVLPSAPLHTPRDILREVGTSGYSHLAEGIRQLRLSLTAGTQEGRVPSIAVVSALSGDGKTTLALGLAKSLALSGRRTVLVDLDTRAPALLAGSTLALEDWACGAARLDQVLVHDPEHGIAVLGLRAGLTTAGGPGADRLGPNILDGLFEELDRRFEAVVIDTPPLLAVSDGLAIASRASRILCVLRARHTPRRALTHALDALRTVGHRPDGLILSHAARDDDPEIHPAAYPVR